VRGIKIRIEAISSPTPEPIRPYGSMPKLEKIYTLSGAALNLKKSVCTKITTAVNLIIQVKNGFHTSWWFRCIDGLI
jgi:hypothetical protein